MNLQTVMTELAALGTERTKKTYLSQGAREPLFGVATGAMKPLAKKIGKDYDLSMALYDTGNYDAAYFAGVIADPRRMTDADFEHWMESAYFYMMSDYIVAVTLAETDIAQQVADRWIDSQKELYQSAGWSCYCWLLGVKPDDYFSQDKLHAMLNRAADEIHQQPNRARYAINEFVAAAGVSYLPLHEETLEIARQIGKVEIDVGKPKCKTYSAFETITKAKEKGRIGFKRRSVRC